MRYPHLCLLGTCLQIATLTMAAEPSPLPRTLAKLEERQPLTIVCMGDSVTGIYYHTGGRLAYPEILSSALRKCFRNPTWILSMGASVDKVQPMGSAIGKRRATPPATAGDDHVRH